jgi:hypothetical protein
LSNDVSNLLLIKLSVHQNNVSALANRAKLVIQFVYMVYDDNYEGGASNSAKINQLTFQKNSELLVKSEPTDNSQVEEE